LNSNNNYNKNNNKNKNNADNNNKKRRAIRSRVSRTLVWQYFLALVIYTVLYVVLGLAGIQLAIKISWRTTPLYYIGIFVQEYFMAFVVGFYAAGIVMLTYYFMSKPLKYLDDIIDATGQMLENKDEVIVLPKAMRNVEDELNMLREQSVKNELIARAAEQRKNDLIVYLAHDLKTPLTSVIGYLNLLVDEPDISAATRARYTGIALEKAERLEELINDFFDITRFNLTTLSLLPLQPVCALCPCPCTAPMQVFHSPQQVCLQPTDIPAPNRPHRSCHAVPAERRLFLYSLLYNYL
jgi:two-component system, OmpR family, sensor histidine kinase VanS